MAEETQLFRGCSQIRWGDRIMDNTLAIKLFEEFNKTGLISCPECGERIEIDAPSCSCGWANELIGAGMV